MPFFSEHEPSAAHNCEHIQNLTLYKDFSLQETGIRLQWNDECFRQLLDEVPLKYPVQLTFTLGSLADQHYFSPSDKQATIFLRQFLDFIQFYKGQTAVTLSPRTLSFLQHTLDLTDTQIQELAKCSEVRAASKIRQYIIRYINSLVTEIFVQAQAQQNIIEDQHKNLTETSARSKFELLPITTVMGAITTVAFVYILTTHLEWDSLLWAEAISGIILTAMSFAYETNDRHTVRFSRASQQAKTLSDGKSLISISFPNV